jgi:large subunit ribosomal protein L29
MRLGGWVARPERAWGEPITPFQGVPRTEYLTRLRSFLGLDAMAKTKTDDYRQMSDEQLKLALNDVVKNLFHLRFQSATDRLETPSEMLKAKREVARIKTVIRMRELEKASQETAAKGA